MNDDDDDISDISSNSDTIYRNTLYEMIIHARNTKLIIPEEYKKTMLFFLLKDFESKNQDVSKYFEQLGFEHREEFDLFFDYDSETPEIQIDKFLIKVYSLLNKTQKIEMESFMSEFMTGYTYKLPTFANKSNFMTTYNPTKVGGKRRKSKKQKTKNKKQKTKNKKQKQKNKKQTRKRRKTNFLNIF